MNIILYIAIISAVVYYVLKLLIQKKNSDYQSSKGTADKKSLSLNNDKLIYAGNVSLDLLKQAIEDFTNNYRNSKSPFPHPLSKIHVIDDSSFMISFPENIDFETFCYYINYLKYPIDIEYSIEISAWTTTKSEYISLNGNFENEKCMIYIASDDDEYDNVILTLQNGTSYKLDFGGNLNEFDSNSIRAYEHPKYNEKDLYKFKALEIK